MTLPFTTEEFLQVFQNYNLAVWPVQVLLFLLGIAAVFLAVKSTAHSGRLISAVLSLLWLWMGVVYHLLNFAAINKAAYVFGFLFIIQSFVFVYFGVVNERLWLQYSPDVYGMTGAVLMMYAMILYPILGHFLGHVYPKSPTFGLPCPTTIFTFGMLLWSRNRLSPLVLAIPLLWSVIGFIAALSLGMIEDTGLLVAGLVGTVLIFTTNKTVQEPEVRRRDF